MFLLLDNDDHDNGDNNDEDDINNDAQERT